MEIDLRANLKATKYTKLLKNTLVDLFDIEEAAFDSFAYQQKLYNQLLLIQKEIQELEIGNEGTIDLLKRKITDYKKQLEDSNESLKSLYELLNSAKKIHEEKLEQELIFQEKEKNGYEAYIEYYEVLLRENQK
ncbi:hypothetical protein [Runella sp.]|uniref:hypothetical protein n=1 Tax=Runella sp. TaxID=1960881 RepID=UPI003D140F58